MELNLSDEELEETYSHNEDAQLIIEGEYFVYANKKALELIGASSIKIFKSLHPAMISPEYQPDGELSRLKSNFCFSQLPIHKSMRFQWQHINLKKETFDVIVTLRVREENEKTFIDVHWK